MKIPMKQPPQISSYPTNWPRDGRSKILDRDDVTIIVHPERQPHKYEPETKKWSPL